MIKHTIGWIAVILAILSLAPSIVPGVMSLIGLMVSLGALVLSISSVGDGKNTYFKVTLSIVIAGLFLVNDALRVWEPLPMSINIKLSLYAIVSFVVLVSIFSANKLSKHK